MKENINKKWVVDTILEGFIPSIALIIILACTCGRVEDSGFIYFDWEITGFIFLVCVVSFISFILLCRIKYKDVNGFSRISGLIYTLIIGILTYILTASSHWGSSFWGAEVSFVNVVLIGLISVILWLVSQYKRFDFSN